MSDTDSVYEQQYDSDSTAEGNVPQRSCRGSKGGKPLKEEPISLVQL